MKDLINSMDWAQEEKDWWVSMLPSMSCGQKARLALILRTELDKLRQAEEDYSNGTLISLK